MTVADLQKYLRALADAIGASKGPAKELEDAANALAPFSKYKMEAFAKFLQLAEAKYGATGELPDGKPAKPPKPGKPTAEAFTAAIAGLKARLQRGEALDRAAVAAEVNKYEKLSLSDIHAVTDRLGFPVRPKPKAKALEAVVTHILAPHTAVARSDV